MIKRLLALALLAAVLGGSSGCCGGPLCCLEKSYWRHHWGCSQCGEYYWSEWFNDPPDCCDPCNNCGDYVGKKPCSRCAQGPACSECVGPICSECSTGSSCSTCGDRPHARHAHHREMPDGDEMYQE